MQVRKERTHACGLTNLDFRTKGDLANEDKFHFTTIRSNFGTMGRKGFQPKVPKRSSTPLNPCSQFPMNEARTRTTHDFYETIGKKVRAPTMTAKARSRFFGEDHRLDRIFNATNEGHEARLCKSVQRRAKGGYRRGQTIAVTDKEKAQETDYGRTIIGLDSFREVDRDKLKKKTDINAEVDQETQLVKIENKNTLQGKVNLLKVRDIRRAIRRRYATRKHPQKIFAQWDHKKQGMIDSDDIVRMITKLGININKDEAHVLLLSADENKDGGLDLKEFHEMIYSNNEALNVDLGKIPVGASDDTTKKLMANMSDQIKARRNEAAEQQLKMFVQKNL